MTIDAHIAHRISTLRKARRLTLDELAALSQVSRSMISLIERQRTSPTAVVLNKLADALGTTLPELFAESAETPTPSPLARHADQPTWTDPASGYLRRHVSPSLQPSPIDLVEVHFPPGKRVAFERAGHQHAIHQHLWLLEGTMHITADDSTWHLHPGDCLALQHEQHILFHNPGPHPARYALIVATPPSPARNA